MVAGVWIDAATREAWRAVNEVAALAKVAEITKGRWSV